MTSTPAYRNDVVGETSVSANYSELALSATQFVAVQRPLRNGMISTELTELLRDPEYRGSDRQRVLQSLHTLANKGDLTARFALDNSHIPSREVSET